MSDITEQTLLRESIQEQKNFAENLTQNSAVATFVLDRRHKVVIWNKACEELTGARESRMLGTDDQWKPFYDHKRPVLADVVIDAAFDRLSELYPIHARSILSPDAMHAEGWYRNLNGKDRYILFDAAPLRDGKGKLIGAVETLQDITELTLADEEIKRGYDTQKVINSLLSLSLEDIPLDDIVKRALDLILSIPWLSVQSRGAVFLVENDPGVLVMKSQSKLAGPIQAACSQVPFGKCLCGRAAQSKQTQFASRLDERHEVRYEGLVAHGHYCVPITIADRTLGVITVYLDEGHESSQREQEFLAAIAYTLAGIIVRRRAEEFIADRENTLRAITDTASDAVVLVNDEGEIIFWNSSASRIFGYRGEEITGQSVTTIIPMRYRGPHLTAFNGFTGTGRGAMLGKTFETTALRKDGVEIPVELSISGIRLKNKWHSAGIIRDITERKKLEEQLRQAQKMEAIGRLAGGIAHDFNNILSAIIGYGHILHMKMSAADALRPHVERLLESADRAAHLTHSLLAFSRKQIIHLKPVDLNETVKRVGKFLRRIIGEDIDLETRLAKEPMVVEADAGQLEQVLMNLATNARDAMQLGGALTIETARTDLDETFVRAYGYGEPGRYATLTVSDTGSGMDAAMQKRIFEPFFTTKEVGKGTGLGLSIAYGIIKQHNGIINVYSEPDKGTVFRIYLPAVRAAAEDKRVQELLPPLTGGTETVLLAEDDEALRILTRTVLESFGYGVIEADNGEDAVRKFAHYQDRIRLLLFDMIMPKKGGREAYEEIRKIKPGVKAIFVSGYTADTARFGTSSGDEVELLLKPVSPGALLRKVREVLDKG
jgi:two-component system NtrC family sensor kinase